LAKALADVWTRSLFAHGVQLVLAQYLLDVVEPRARRRGLDAYPFGFFQALGLDDLDGNTRGLVARLLLLRWVVGGLRHGGFAIDILFNRFSHTSSCSLNLFAR